MIKADIIADSMAPNGVRLTTYVLIYPRFIHSEVMTHRMFSRNASSSRAIPVKKQIQMVEDNPAIPLAFTKNKAGMQGGAALEADAHDAAVKVWLQARDMAVIQARHLADLEVHKQYANRILEPFAHITVIVSATEFANFFALRAHSAAQPEIQELAKLMYMARQVSIPFAMEEGELHLPFVSQEEKAQLMSLEVSNNDLVQMSVARCARVSYLNHEGKKPTLEEDRELYQRLVGSAPIHASPAEHQAMAMGKNCQNVFSGNFRGWTQYRKTLENENIENFTLTR